MQRRNFVKSISISAAGMAFSPSIFAAPDRRPLGVQVWTIREYLKKDLVGSLAKLAKLGYNELELFDYNGTYWGKSPKEFNKICNDLGLTVISSHYETGRHDNAKGTLLNGWQKAVDDAAEMNIKYMICAWIYKEERTSIDLYKALANMLNTAGEACSKSRFNSAITATILNFHQLMELCLMTCCCKSTDKDLVKMEADLFWITKAGVDPVDYFNKYPGVFRYGM
jgi:sugar phosphate isomerase/epimerase